MSQGSAVASPTGAPPSTLLGQLKADTASLHARIEQVVPLLDDGFGRQHYAAWLLRLVAYVLPIEERLGAHAAGLARFGVDLSARLRARLLVEDLAALGHRVDAAHLPRPVALPALADLAEAWGCLYVLEGSTLGGQILLRELSPRLGLSADAGLRYFGGHGARTGEMWRAFGAASARFDAAGADRDAVVRGARETFLTQAEWLAGWWPEVGSEADAPSPDQAVG